MIAADALRAAAIGGLAIGLVVGGVAFWVLPCVAFVEGIGSTVFNAAQPGALRAVVPAGQLPAAAGAQSGRTAAVRIIGPPLGGALFEAGRALPFLADALSYACSTVSLLLMRARFQEERERGSGHGTPARRGGAGVHVATAVSAHDRLLVRPVEFQRPRPAVLHCGHR